MLRHNAIEAWETMLKTGWERCSPPVRCGDMQQKTRLAAGEDWLKALV